MQPNIDERGARFRLVWGVMILVVAVFVTGLALWSGIWWLWLIAGLCIIGGALAIYESRCKWCAMRAIGVKTKF